MLLIFYEQRKTNICKYLTEGGAGEIKAKKDRPATTLFHWCLKNNDLRFAEFLVENGLSVNIKGEDERTALHDAAAEGNIDFARWLLDHGADVNAKGSKGETPLNRAKSQEMKNLLTSHGGEKCRI